MCLAIELTPGCCPSVCMLQSQRRCGRGTTRHACVPGIFNQKAHCVCSASTVCRLADYIVSAVQRNTQETQFIYVLIIICHYSQHFRLGCPSNSCTLHIMDSEQLYLTCVNFNQVLSTILTVLHMVEAMAKQHYNSIVSIKFNGHQDKRFTQT